MIFGFITLLGLLTSACGPGEIVSENHIAFSPAAVTSLAPEFTAVPTATPYPTPTALPTPFDRYTEHNYELVVGCSYTFVYPTTNEMLGIDFITEDLVVYKDGFKSKSSIIWRTNLLVEQTSVFECDGGNNGYGGVCTVTVENSFSDSSVYIGYYSTAMNGLTQGQFLIGELYVHPQVFLSSGWNPDPITKVCQ
jgi:hypothetical protein